jgi:hypothetical protein
MMGKWLKRAAWWRLAAAASGTVFFLEGCNPTLRSVAEDGIINTSTSFLAAFLRALIEVGLEGDTTTTAMKAVEHTARLLAA